MRKNKKFLAVSLCGGLAAIAFGAGLYSMNLQIGSSETTLLSEFLEKEHIVGTQVILPDYKFEDGTQEIKAEKIVYFPSGQGYTGETITLTEMGEYELQYYAQKDGVSYSKTEKFQVSSQLFSVNGKKSKMDFGNVSDFTQYKANTRSGMILDLAQGETLEYNKVIDFSETKSSQTFVDFSMLPHSIGTADANKILVRLTDIYDPSNYVTFECRKVGSGQNFMERLTYVMAYASNGQLPQGLAVKAQAKSDFVYEGVYYKRHLNDIYGTEVYFPMSGYSITTGTSIALDEKKVGLQDMKLSFDYEAKRVYVNGALIVDFDDPALQTKLWKGFETGECKLSISVAGYNGSSCRMLFNQIGGESTQNNDTMYDYEKPEIFVDSKEFDTLQYAVVGKSVEIPTATARDSYSGNCEVETKVYMNYGNSTQSIVNITDGAFIPKYERVYTVVYRATDQCGNTEMKTYSIQAKETEDEISLDLENATTSVSVGQLVTIGKPIITNAVGNYYVTVKAKKDGVAETLYEIDKNNVDELLYEWRPMSAGTYEIVYSYRDYISEGEVSYNLTVSTDGEDILIGDAVLPKYIIKDAVYVTPTFNGYEFVNGKAIVKKSDVYVSATETYTQNDKIMGDTFTVNSDTAYCWFHFVFGENVRQYKVPVVDVNYGKAPLALHKYFVGDNGTPIIGSENTTYTLADQGGVYGLDFINSLQTFDFSFGFTIPQEANYNKVKVVLTDSVDETQKLVFNYRNTSSTSYFSINDGVEYNLGTKMTGSSFTLSYKNAEKLVTAGVDMNYSVEKDFYGNEWNGFSSGKVWLQVFVEDLTNTNAPQITVDKVNNQFIYNLIMMGMNLTADIVTPQISTPTLKGYFSKGAVVKIVPIQFSDVLDPNAKATFSVKDPNGKSIVSKDGVLLENLTTTNQFYEIELNEYGNYLISYLVEDSAGNKIPYEYGISVVDEIAPTVTINEHKKAVFCGRKIKLATLSIQDDISEASNCKVFTYVQTPDGKRVSVNGNSYKPMKEGEYQVWYYVTDENGNVTIVGYTFTAV